MIQARLERDREATAILCYAINVFTDHTRKAWSYYYVYSETTTCYSSSRQLAFTSYQRKRLGRC
jgi:hypothetical protein